MNDRKIFTIDPHNGDISFLNGFKIFREMSKNQILSLKGVQKNSNLSDIEWYHFPEIKDEIGLLYVTPTTDRAIISHVGIAYIRNDNKSNHEIHCKILKDNFKEIAPTSFIKDKDLPSMPIYPIWTFKWGEVVAGYNQRWEFFEIFVSYH